MELKHMNKWDKAKRGRVIGYIALPIIVYSMISIYLREGITRTYIILTVLTVVAGILEYRKYWRGNHTHEN